jgi:hypothetical protein
LDNKEQGTQKRRKTIKTERKYQRNTILSNKYPFEIDMSNTVTAPPVLTVVKDEFAKVIIEGTLSPTNKPID